jgi:hypothetical protein
MSASKVGLVSLAGLTTIGMLLSNMGNAQAVSIIPSSCGNTCIESTVTDQNDGTWLYSYKIFNNYDLKDSKLNNWFLPLLGITDLKAINQQSLEPGQLSGTGWHRRVYSDLMGGICYRY